MSPACPMASCSNLRVISSRILCSYDLSASGDGNCGEGKRSGSALRAYAAYDAVTVNVGSVGSRFWPLETAWTMAAKWRVNWRAA
jgi:hypothetical protein